MFRYTFSEGARVESSDTILIIESMGMQLEIKAGSNGKVHYLVSLDKRIAFGDVIAEIEK